MRAVPPFSRVLVLVIGLLVVGLPASSATSPDPAPWPRHDRLYLLGSDTDHQYWSVDPADPELGVSTIVRRCGVGGDAGIPGRSKPCSPGGFTSAPVFSLWFSPAAILEQPVDWSPEEPLRFHLELTVDTPGAFSVALALDDGSQLVESPAAEEVAPGVWEGEMVAGGPLDPREYTDVGVRVRPEVRTAHFEFRARGASYVELPASVGSKGVPRLLDEDVHRPAPSSFATPTRSFLFRDEEWDVHSFEGTMDETRTFDLTLAEDAEAVVAWVEAFDTPLVHDVVRRREADPRKVRDWIDVHLRRDGETVASNPAGPIFGHGVVGLAAVDVDAGPLTLEVEASSSSDEAFSYRAYIVSVHGERTLGRMRWTALTEVMAITPAAMRCGTAWGAVPVTREVTSFMVDLDWDTEAPGFPGWTPSYELPTGALVPCSEAGTGDRVRFTFPEERVWLVAATPAYDRTFASAYDTIFEFEVTYAYTPPPPPDPV